jgi:hypothetical protein
MSLTTGHLPIVINAIILYDYHSLSNETRSLPHGLQCVIKRNSHVGRDTPAGELFRPIYFNHSSMEAAMINDVVLEGIVVRT